MLGYAPKIKEWICPSTCPTHPANRYGLKCQHHIGDLSDKSSGFTAYLIFLSLLHSSSIIICLFLKEEIIQSLNPLFHHLKLVSNLKNHFSPSIYDRLNVPVLYMAGHPAVADHHLRKWLTFDIRDMGSSILHMHHGSNQRGF